jgi:50S ribosomal protein L16 3-hydroxylase
MTNKPHSDFGLASLTAPLSSEQFLTEYWPDRLFLNHGDAARIAPMTDIPELRDARSLSRVHHESVIVYLPPEVAEKERRLGGRMRASDAVELYDRGGRIEFNQVDRWVPALREHMQRIERDLGLPAGRLTCSYFAMPPGAVVLPHFDTQPALCIQLKGTKTWHIGRTPAMPAPLHNHVLDTVSPVIGNYYDGELPVKMPEDALEVVMKPGSVLYLPRGHVHATRSHDHTLSVTLDINLPTWTDLLVQTLRSRLSRMEAWRGHALGVDGSAAARGEARSRLTELLPQARTVFEEVLASPDEILDASSPAIMPGPKRRYQRAPGVEMRVENLAPEGEPDWHFLITAPGGDRTDIEVSPELVPLCLWLAERRESFLDIDALYAAHTATRTDLITVLTTLLEIDAIEATAP